MSRPVVLVDIDGVCADFVSPVLRVVERVRGLAPGALEHVHVTTWDMWDCLRCTPEEMARVNAAIDARGFCASLEPLPGAADGVRRLREFCDVYVVTSPWSSETWSYERARWCGDHLGVPRGSIVSTSAKHLVRGDVLVDDKTSTLEEWRRAWPGAGPLLFRQPWNARDRWYGAAAASWDEVLDFVDWRTRA